MIVGNRPRLPKQARLASSLKIEPSFLLASVLVLLAGCGGGGGVDSSATTVKFSFSTGTPTVVAAKTGSGSFMAQSLNSGKLSLPIPNGTTNFAVAYVCIAQSIPTLEAIFEATTADGISFTLPCPVPSSSNSTGAFTGSVDTSSIPSANLLKIAVNNGSKGVLADITPNTNFSITVPAGNDRVEVLAYNSVSDGLQATASLLAARDFDNQTVPGPLNGGNRVVLGAADQTTPEPITYSDVPPGYAAPFTIVDLIMGGIGGFTLEESTSQYPSLPAGAIKSGDNYEFLAYARNSSNPTESTTVAKSSSTAGPVSFSFPAPWSYSGPTPAALPTFNFAYSGFTGSTGVSELALISWGSLTSTTQIMITASANYQNGSTTLTPPDLSGLTGFVANPPSGTQVIWVALISQNNLAIQKSMPANTTISTVENSGAYKVP